METIITQVLKTRILQVLNNSYDEKIRERHIMEIRFWVGTIVVETYDHKVYNLSPKDVFI
jgi:hypothetical protein